MSIIFVILAAIFMVAAVATTEVAEAAKVPSKKVGRDVKGEMVYNTVRNTLIKCGLYYMKGRVMAKALIVLRKECIMSDVPGFWAVWGFRGGMDSRTANGLVIKTRKTVGSKTELFFGVSECGGVTEVYNTFRGAQLALMQHKYARIIGTNAIDDVELIGYCDKFEEVTPEHLAYVAKPQKKEIKEPTASDVRFCLGGIACIFAELAFFAM